jgi:hypothetical protein
VAYSDERSDVEPLKRVELTLFDQNRLHLGGMEWFDLQFKNLQKEL